MTTSITPGTNPAPPSMHGARLSLLEELVQKISDFLKAIFASLACLLQPLCCNAQQPSSPLAAPSAFANQAFTSFYTGQSLNASGVTLEQILSWDDRLLEARHDFIQWLFPLRTPSAYNPTAPVLDEATRTSMSQDPLIRQNILRAFDRMLKFYGFERRQDGSIIHAANYADRCAEWATPGNHNYLRITRILTNLNLMNYGAEAREFFSALDQVAGVDSRSLGIWRSAAHS